MCVSGLSLPVNRAPMRPNRANLRLLATLGRWESRMRPMPCPGLRWAWRSPDTLQFGIDVPHPLIISDLPPVCRPLLSSLDGVRTEEEVVARLVADGIDVTGGLESTAVLKQLVELGVIVDGGQWPGGLPTSRDVRERMLPDVRCASALEKWRLKPAARWDALSRAHVTVVGASRLGATVSRALAAAGVGRVDIDDPGVVTTADVSVGGFALDDVGGRRADLVAARPEPTTTTRTRTRTRTSTRSIERRLVVVTDAVETHTRCRALGAAGTPHLVVSCHELLGRVGPLVAPGRSPCQFCLELARRDVDPGWADIWRQQVADPTPDTDAVLVGITAHIAAAHILDWLTDGQPPSVGGFVEVAAPDGTTTRRRFSQHPECGCAWPDPDASLTMAR